MELIINNLICIEDLALLNCEDSEYLKNLIVKTINEMVNNADTMTKYRRPLVLFSNIRDEDFTFLKRNVSLKHKIPRDLLLDAVNIVSFFIPFAEDIVDENRLCSTVAEEWAIAYVETNTLIDQISSTLVGKLREEGVQVSWEPPTHNFDKVTLTSIWSHKSIAKITGLGSFGLHQMIITDAGCAGRLGSLIINAKIKPTPKKVKERCFYYIDGSCSICLANCPVGALTVKGLNKKKCWQHIQEIDSRFSYLSNKYKLAGPFDVCGKCVTGPCAII